MTELADMPSLPSSSFAVTTVTPVGRWPSTRRNSDPLIGVADVLGIWKAIVGEALRPKKRTSCPERSM